MAVAVPKPTKVAPPQSQPPPPLLWFSTIVGRSSIFVA
jgi:hypothetical protein